MAGTPGRPESEAEICKVGGMAWNGQHGVVRLVLIAIFRPPFGCLASCTNCAPIAAALKARAFATDNIMS